MRSSFDVAEQSPIFAMPTYRLRFLFDAGSGTCLWAGNDAARERFGYAVAIDALPLVPGTRTRGAALVAQHDTSIDWDDPAGPSPWSAAERARFAADSEAFLAELRKELGTEFEVLDERGDTAAS